MTKKKEAPAKEQETKKHEWLIQNSEVLSTPTRLMEIEFKGFEIVSVTPVSGAFGVQMVIVGKKEVKS